MEISPSSQPVNFYTKNTGNTINMAINDDNHLYTTNVFSPEFITEKTSKVQTQQKKRKKSKRLNTLDSDYLPDEVDEITETETDNNNFFLNEEKKKSSNSLKNLIEHFFTETPLINYFFMKRKKQKIQKTVETLNDINQNVDELLNTAVPYGEAYNVYSDIAKNLTNAANLIGKVNKGI